MAIILICVYPLAGPINATRKVVRDLRQRGHSVHYIGTAECHQYLLDESFFPVFSNLFPAANGEERKQRSLIGRVRTGRNLSRSAERLVEGMIKGKFNGFDRVVETIRPDLMVIESTHFYAALWGLLAFRFNIPSILLNDSLTGPENMFVPPITSCSQPLTSPVGSLKTWLEWKLVAIDRRLRGLCSKVILGWDLGNLARKLATAFEFPVDLLCDHEKFFIRTKAPEIVLIPEAFDFPHFSSPDRYYTSSSVDLLRSESSFPWELLDPTIPVIYCSLGTTEYFGSDKYHDFYESVIRAFETFSDRYQLVLATCDHCVPDSIVKRSRNVTVVRRAPQIALLKRSVLMITHGGANTVKECVSLGVPMLLCPVGFDTCGFAARSIYHGLGLKIDFHWSGPNEIRRALEQLLTQPYYRLQSRRMQREFLAAEQTRPAAAYIEMFLP